VKVGFLTVDIFRLSGFFFICHLKCNTTKEFSIAFYVKLKKIELSYRIHLKFNINDTHISWKGYLIGRLTPISTIFQLNHGGQFYRWSCEFESHSWWSVVDATLCDKVCQWLATGRWFSPSTLISSINKTGLKVKYRILISNKYIFYRQCPKQ
jgi:hypothetical protein